MSDATPERGEIWQDAEGMPMGITGDKGELAVTFGIGEPLVIEFLEYPDKPESRVFAADGRYVGDGRLSYDRINPEGMKERAERYKARMRDAGYYDEDDHEHVHEELHVVDVGPDGNLREVARASGADIPEVLRRVISETVSRRRSKPNAM